MLGYTTLLTGGPDDFDFLAGEWTVLHRRLQARGVGCTEWETFPGACRAARHLGGLVSVDEITCPAQGWSGVTVRNFDLATRQWSIRWISSLAGALEPPVLGGFDGDRGTFYGEDTHGGEPVKVRFLWTRSGADAARWEQAFSHGGRAWETNWVMELDRAKR